MLYEVITIKQVFAWGGNGVQIGTPFAVTEEGDAHLNFKKILAEALPQQIRITSYNVCYTKLLRRPVC